MEAGHTEVLWSFAIINLSPQFASYCMWLRTGDSHFIYFFLAFESQCNPEVLQEVCEN